MGGAVAPSGVAAVGTIATGVASAGVAAVAGDAAATGVASPGTGVAGSSSVTTTEIPGVPSSSTMTSTETPWCPSGEASSTAAVVSSTSAASVAASSVGAGSRCGGLIAARGEGHEGDGADSDQRQPGSGRAKTWHGSASSWTTGGPSPIPRKPDSETTSVVVAPSYGHARLPASGRDREAAMLDR